MNLIGLILGIALLAVIGGGYVVTHKTGEEVVKDTFTTGQEAIDTAKDIVADANMKDAKMMAEETMMEVKKGSEEGIDVMNKKDGAMIKGGMEVAGKAMMSPGSYETYSPEKLAKANDGKVVLFFRASWCPTCKAVDADIHANATAIPKGVAILDVNYDDSTALKQKYGVTYQHTFVQVDAKGNMIAKWSGSPTLAAVVAKINQ